MNLTIKIGLIIYIMIIIQCSVTMTVLFLKSKKTVKLYSLLICNVFAILWMFFVFFEKFASGTEYYLFFIRFPLVAIHLLSASGLVFVLFYLEILVFKNMWMALLFFIPDIICFLPYFSNKYFYLIVEKCVNNATVIEWGPVLWFSKILSYLYLLIALLLLLWDIKKEKHYYISNVLMIFVIVVPMTMHFLMEAKVFNPNGFDYVPITFSLVLTFYSVLTFKYKIIDIIPKASNELFNYSSSAVIILNKDGLLEDYNKSFETIYKKKFLKGVDTSNEILNYMGKFCFNKDVFIKIKNNILNNVNEISEETLIFLLPGHLKKQYVLNMVPLTTKKGYYIGKMIIFYDITEHRESTIQEERSRLSNDLHDSLGNSINVISSNLEYIIKNIEKDNINEELKECVDVSYKKSISAFMDLRRIVDDLYPVDIEKNGILWALNSMLYRLRIKGINIEFSYSDIDDIMISKNGIGLNIYAICQEALNNAVVHGNAKKITISLVQQIDKVKLYILDDGSGCENIIKNKGITSMEKRTKELKGTIEYGAPTEGGFNIKIIIPI